MGPTPQKRVRGRGCLIVALLCCALVFGGLMIAQTMVAKGMRPTRLPAGAAPATTPDPVPEAEQSLDVELDPIEEESAAEPATVDEEIEGDKTSEEDGGEEALGSSEAEDPVPTEEDAEGGEPGAVPEETGGGPVFHTFISTDCSAYSDWMSEVLIYSHWKTGTSGGLTRIAACADKKYKYPTIWHPRYTIHVSDNYATQRLDDGKEDKYTPYNKPLGVQHWLDAGAGGLPDDAVVAMIDTDMIYNLPLENAFKTKEGEWAVKPGQPGGTVYGIGAGWFDNAIKMNKGRQLMECDGEYGPCKDTTSSVIMAHYVVGAPVAMVLGDWKKVTPLWFRYTIKLRQVQQGWMDEMLGYVMGAMHHGLRHKMTCSIMASNAGVVESEAWEWTEGLDPSGRVKHHNRDQKRFYTPLYSGTEAPILHYCQTYKVEGKMKGGAMDVWSKYANDWVPAGKADCEPLKPYPYDDEQLLALQLDPATEENQGHVRKMAYMIRGVAGGVWEGLSHYKAAVCGHEPLPRVPAVFPFSDRSAHAKGGAAPGSHGAGRRAGRMHGREFGGADGRGFLRSGAGARAYRRRGRRGAAGARLEESSSE